MPVDVSVLSLFRLGAVKVIEEPDRSVKLKVVALTVIDSIVAAEPATLIVTPLTLMIVSLVKLTSLYRARAKAGRSSAVRAPETRSFFMSVRYELIM